MTNDWRERDPKPFDSGPDPEPDGVDVTEGEIGSANLKDPAEVEVQGKRFDDATLPEAGVAVPEGREDHR